MACNKTTYRTKAQVRGVRAKRHHHGAPRLYIYKCKPCRGYHLTRQRYGKNPKVK